MHKFDKNNSHNQAFWQQRYEQGKTGWDIGNISPPIKDFIDRELVEADKDLSILIAGAGNAYEAKYLHKCGFTNLTVVDFAHTPLVNFSQSVPTFNPKHLLHSDFFTLDTTKYQFDLSIEQTFFCAIPIAKRSDFVKKTHALLKPNGRLIGVLWDCEFRGDEPPFGGSKAEYEALFSNYFELVTLETCKNSHPKRQGRELFIDFIKKLFR